MNVSSKGLSQLKSFDQLFQKLAGGKTLSLKLDGVGLYAAYDFSLDERVLPVGVYFDVRIVVDDRKAVVYLEAKRLFTVLKQKTAPNGISWIAACLFDVTIREK